MAVVVNFVLYRSDDNLFDFRYNIFTSWKILKGGKWVSDGARIFSIQILIVSLRGSFCIDTSRSFLYNISIVATSDDSTEYRGTIATLV